MKYYAVFQSYTAPFAVLIHNSSDQPDQLVKSRALITVRADVLDTLKAAVFNDVVFQLDARNEVAVVPERYVTDCLVDSPHSNEPLRIFGLDQVGRRSDFGTHKR